MPITDAADPPPRREIAPPEEDPNAIIQCASPPCFLHELDPSWLGVMAWPEVRAWRRARRQALIADRLAAPREAREVRDAAITPRLSAMLPAPDGRLLGFYWPFRGEYDPRPLARALHAAGMRLALPVVLAKGTPMIFRPWSPGTRLVPGIWDIPIPADGEAVVPDMLLVPLVGFDLGGYRLGHGGGYYDRTLAAMAKRPFAIGVGFDQGGLTTIHPQPHDIPMDAIVTESRTIALRHAAGA
ncbi:MAG TPA: 5-formyltetrahydrofolate cyclo-ligase [Roseomonas sp.]|jgi:5-formyltetrahydrofolate cyclo-ligase